MARTARGWLLVLTLLAIGFLALFQFFRDVFRPAWPHWVLTPIVAAAFLWLSGRLDEGNPNLAAAFRFVLSVFLFAGIYDGLDYFVGPDWPLWFVTPVVLAVIWMAIVYRAEARDG